MKHETLAPSSKHEWITIGVGDRDDERVDWCPVCDGAAVRGQLGDQCYSIGSTEPDDGTVLQPPPHCAPPKRRRSK